jgi:hypothetical protein
MAGYMAANQFPPYPELSDFIAFTQQEMIYWYSESAQYNASSPTASDFTQLVWKGTTKIGCAWSLNCPNVHDNDPYGTFDHYLLYCEYEPKGNIAGQYQQNVSP